MRGLSRATLVACLVLARPLSGQITYESTTGNVNDTDCRGLKLVAAEGVPSGSLRKYKFHGLCKILRVYPKTGSWAGFEWSEGADVSQLGSVWMDLAASWNSSTGEFKESAKTQSPYAGGIAMVLRCAGDPVLTGIACQAVAYSNTTGWDGFDWAYQVPRPISRGKTTLEEATTLSQQTASNPSNPPPPPPAPSSPAVTVLRAPVPSGTEPVAAVPPRIVVEPTRVAPTPSPTPPPTRTAPTTPTATRTPTPTPPPPKSSSEIALFPGVRIELDNGRAIVAGRSDGSLCWELVGRKGGLMRRFPLNSKLKESGHHDLTIRWPGGSYPAGKRAEKPKAKDGHK